MNAFEPSTTQSPSSKRPVVWTSRRVGAGAGLGEARTRRAPRHAASGASQRSFCSSVPNRFRSGCRARPIAADSVIATDWSTRAELLQREQTVTASASDPPYASGNGRPNKPEVAHLLHHLERELLLPVGLGRPGLTTSSANSRTTAAERLLLRSQVEVHPCRKPSMSRMDPVRSAATTASTRAPICHGPSTDQPMHQHGVGAVELDEADRRPAGRAVRRRCRRSPS